MRLYFTKFGPNFRGRPITTIATVLNGDITRVDPALRLRTLSDLEHLRSIAQNRREWNSLTKKITEIAEASYSVGQDAKSN